MAHNSTYVSLLLLNMTLSEDYSQIAHPQNTNLKILDMEISDQQRFKICGLLD